MKREFLRGLDLSDEVIDKIMAKHGETVEKFKAGGDGAAPGPKIEEEL